MDVLEILSSMFDQYSYYFDVKIPDLSQFIGIRKVLVCAMGGSAFPVEIVADHIKENYKQEMVYLTRNYKLPYWVDEKTLVIAASFSGSTEETLSCMKEAMERNIPIMGLSMGGEISRICSEKNLPYVSLPKVVMPRFGIGYLISAILRIMVEAKMIPKQDEEINNIKILLDPLKINIQKTAESMSKSLKGRILAIYTDEEHKTAGTIAKICINETGKIIGYNNIYSESNHNELESLTMLNNPMGLVLLTYKSQNPRISQRFELLKQLLPDKDINYQKVNSNFEKILYREIYCAIFFTYLAYYLAIESNHDPVATPAQDKIKILLKQIKTE